MNNPYKPIDIAADQLVKLYQQGYIELLKRYNELSIAGNDTKHTRALLKEIMNILNELDSNTASWIEKIIPESYKMGYEAAYIMYPGYESKEKYFSGIHKQAIEVIAYNMQSSLLDATQKVGRQANDLYRKIGLDAARKRLMLGESRKWTQEDIKKTLEDNGLTAFVDKAGRNWKLDTYAEVVARTTSREIITQGTINRILESGRDLVQISSHSTTCSICAPLQGKVFSLTGKTEGYPKYKDYIPVHPRCRHILMGYIRDFDSNADETQRFSNTSLTKDNRTKSEKKAYEDEQIEKTKFRLDKEQYQKYVKKLGKEAPKSFSGFRSIKKANNENWPNLQKKFTDDVSKETNDDIINNIKSGKYNLTLNKQAYEKHIEGHKRYEDYVSRLKSKGSPHLPSSLTISYEEAQELIKNFSGTGQIIINRGQVKEIIKDNNKVIGIFRDIPNGIEEETTNFIIHYSKSSKKGAHIVPLEEDKDV
ncbi:hypothetical protein A0J52_09920 [Clostridium sporogenes]|uniref:phage minor capsid protein n=1 Tax=Clostridium sporogenes TaxID=1509 RepID=UPI0007800E1F|nr:phage minor capsid protein [Clostridium sporogenes]KYN77168.1 hypothetical protein A0J52_09920 [Clostridium sporogenes]